MQVCKSSLISSFLCSNLRSDRLVSSRSVRSEMPQPRSLQRDEVVRWAVRGSSAELWTAAVVRRPDGWWIQWMCRTVARARWVAKLKMLVAKEERVRVEEGDGKERELISGISYIRLREGKAWLAAFGADIRPGVTGACLAFRHGRCCCGRRQLDCLLLPPSPLGPPVSSHDYSEPARTDWSCLHAHKLSRLRDR